MADETPHLEAVGSIADALNDIGLTPILVGGMALVILGSRRVTQDFDFVIPSPGSRLSALVDAFYDRGFELAARVDPRGQIAATIDNRRVAAVRLRVDAPLSAYFYNPGTGLRIDLLFDFPIAAQALAETATPVRVRSTRLRVASEDNLLRLKQIARAARSLPADAEDIAFLESLRAERDEEPGS